MGKAIEAIDRDKRCCICSSEDIKDHFLLTNMFHIGSAVFKKCTQCDFLQMVVTEEKLAEIYEAGDRENLTQKLDTSRPERNQIFTNAVLSLARDILHLDPSLVSTLDYGCGGCELSLLEKQNGINLAHCFDEYIVSGKNSDHLSKLESDHLSNFACTIITMSSVIEHLYQPAKSFLECRSAVAKEPNGMLVNVEFFDPLQHDETWWHLLPEQSQHINHFSKKSFELLCAKTGWEIVEYGYQHPAIVLLAARVN